MVDYGGLTLIGWSKPVAKHSFNSLISRLSRAGFGRDFVRSAIIPDWWDDSCATDPELLRDVEIRVARFLQLPLAAVREASAPLALPTYQDAQLRRVRSVDRDRLQPALHAATSVAGAVVRSLRGSVEQPEPPPESGLAWRELIAPGGQPVTLSDTLADLWRRGIPVVSLDVYPSPSFQGMACIAEGRPVIVLGHRFDEPGRVAFAVAHEAGHLAAGDCAPEQPVVDGDDEGAEDDGDIEGRADQFASNVLVGSRTVPTVEADDFKQLAKRADEMERVSGADASTIIFAWARRTGDYPTATLAVKALYRGSGALRMLAEALGQHLDFGAASETDRSLLQCARVGSRE